MYIANLLPGFGNDFTHTSKILKFMVPRKTFNLNKFLKIIFFLKQLQSCSQVFSIEIFLL